MQAIYSGELNFEQAEQGLIAGHSVHPAPKSREQFSESDARLFTPEHQTQFALYWFAVSPSIAITDSTGQYEINERIQQLLTADTQLSEAILDKVPDNYLLLPVHPWQAKLLLNIRDIQQYQEKGLLVNLGAIGANWYPTSSTRSLYSPGLPYMLKFSLSVKLTNSIRNLSLKEVIRGTRLQQVFNTEQLCSFGQQYASFKVMQEPAFIGLINSKSEAIDESLVALRDNLLMHASQEEAVVLATLTQQHPLAEDSLIADRVKTVASHKNISISQAAKYWFNQYCQYVVEPLFALQANYGIVLLAHQQNIVLKMEQGEPVGMYYRDCQGTGYTELAYQLFPEQLIDDAQMPENFWSKDKVLRYFPYYLIINSTYNTIAAISARCDVSEKDLLHILHASLKQMQSQGVQDSFCLDFVLQNATLRSKGNFFCYLQNYNENSIPDPAVIYFDLENPIAKIEQSASAKNTSTTKVVSGIV
nr:IucA/IucC family protein [Spartinivicinus marinus]